MGQFENRPDRGAKLTHYPEDLILAAFRRAEAEGRRDAAEHLVRAFEALCPCLSDVPPSGSALARPTAAWHGRSNAAAGAASASTAATPAA